MTKNTVLIRKAFLSGTSLDVTVDLGFKPETLTMSVYDRNALVYPATNTIVNDRDDVDVLVYCSDEGVVAVTLNADDTTVVPVTTRRPPSQYRRHVLFTYTWDSLVNTGKYLVTLTIAPDYEGSAT